MRTPKKQIPSEIIGNYAKNVAIWMPQDGAWRRMHTLKTATELQWHRTRGQKWTFGKDSGR